MLSLWSFPNVYTDEGKRGAGDGKELCDLLVVFGNDVLLFSDKDCAFPPDSQLELAWSRWYRRAIERSAKQLAGAEKWISRFPDRLFLDPGCKSRLPIPLPEFDKCRVHLIAVAHGSLNRAEQHWDSIAKGSSGSLILDTALIGRQHQEQPFKIGWPLEGKRFVHVFDDFTLSLLLKELDTVSDFVDYLSKKQRLFEKSGCDFLILGEEELLAAYLTSTDGQTTERGFPEFEPGALVFLGEGRWKELETSPAYRARGEANEISYLWDDLIEYQASHVVHGSSQVMSITNGPHSPERVLRVMASENRVARRSLGASIRKGRSIATQQRRFTRCIASTVPTRVYALMMLPYFPEQPHSEYREYRQYLLYTYCEGVLLRIPGVNEIVGIAMEPYDADIVSVDFMYFHVEGDPVDPKYRQEIEERLRRENLWGPRSAFSWIPKDTEFP